MLLLLLSKSKAKTDWIKSEMASKLKQCNLVANDDDDDEVNRLNLTDEHTWQ